MVVTFLLLDTARGVLLLLLLLAAFFPKIRTCSVFPSKIIKF